MRVGLVTIGQSPRVDVVPEMRPYMGGAEVIECGALDGLTLEEVEELAPREGEHVLVTRLRDGTQVSVSRERIIGRLQGCIRRLEAEADVIGLLCTGDFPELESRKMLIEPSTLILKTVEALKPSRLGVMVPDPRQVGWAVERWSKTGAAVTVQSASPYAGGGGGIEEAAERLRDADPDLIILDCIGYNVNAKRLVKRVTGKPVILPRTLMARVIGELAEG